MIIKSKRINEPPGYGPGNWLRAVGIHGPVWAVDFFILLFGETVVYGL
jgi:hypothetical protein